MTDTSTFATPPSGGSAPAPTPVRGQAHDAATLSALQNTAADQAILIKGGTILSQDPAVGDLVGDVLIRGGQIIEIGPDLEASATDAVVVDATGTIVAPGFVDSHVHAWEGQLRGTAPTLDFGDYLGFTAFGYGPAYRPHDNYVGTLATALVALDAGITTIIDNSHNSRTPDHSNAAIEALRDAGIRGVHASGAPVGGDSAQWLSDVTRLRSEYFSSDDQLLTLRLFDLYPSVEVWDFARGENLWISHEMGAHIENIEDVITDLSGRGLLTDTHTFNHCFNLPDKVWDMLGDSGATVNVCPRSDAAFGLGTAFPPIDKIRELGILPGLSGDNEISYGLSMFTEMQTLLNGHRGRTFEKTVLGQDNVPSHLSPADVLTYATLGGATNAGLADRTGSLTPGKDADIVLIRATDINTAPLSNALATVTAFAHAGNVDTVFVAGQVRKFRGELVGQDLNKIRSLIESSRDYLYSARSLTGDIFAEQGTIAPDGN
ncbi:amidohydrolase family protein [Rhodococcus aetherivorans]|uniref:amidohydrolase family protein n=1 Tax=Rhodococcus aetherivorans TaxID=191292 RepID=UPI00369A1D20